MHYPALVFGGMNKQDPYVGARIPDGDYLIVDIIGEGRIGVVYRAVQEITGTEVAVKILYFKHALDAELVKRLRSDVPIMCCLHHPCNMRVLGHGEMDDGALYIVMELLHGRGLDVALQQDGPWTLDRAVGVVRRVAYALEEAHRRGLVHQNLGPGNIFLVKGLEGAERPRVLECGMSLTPVKGDSGGMDVPSAPWYMSPEQSFAEELDGRANIYSLAAILYKLLTGECPFDDGYHEGVGRYLNEPMPIHLRVDRAFPPELWPVLERALARLPEDRFLTMMDFAEALRPFHTTPTSLESPAAPPRSYAEPQKLSNPPAAPRSAVETRAPSGPPAPAPLESSPVVPEPRPLGRTLSQNTLVLALAGVVLVLAVVIAALLRR